jgi:hypothetical protein
MTTTRSTAAGSSSAVPQRVSSPDTLMGKIRGLGITGIIVAVLLSVAGVLLVLSPENNGTASAAVGVLFMTTPVLLARRWPILAVSIVAIAAIANGLLWDDIVRCGAAIPALLYISFAIGRRAPLGAEREQGSGWFRPLLGLAIAFVSVAAQGLWDPALQDDFYPYGVGLVLLAWGAGVGWSALDRRRRTRKAQLS